MELNGPGETVTLVVGSPEPGTCRRSLEDGGGVISTGWVIYRAPSIAEKLGERSPETYARVIWRTAVAMGGLTVVTLIVALFEAVERAVKGTVAVEIHHSESIELGPVLRVKPLDLYLRQSNSLCTKTEFILTVVHRLQ